jgi:hypothetical protein
MILKWCIQTDMKRYRWDGRTAQGDCVAPDLYILCALNWGPATGGDTTLRSAAVAY